MRPCCNKECMTRREMIRIGGVASLAATIPMPFTNLLIFNEMIDKENFDVIIIGGSYSGLSAALALGRSLKSVLIIDGGNPCNKQTPHSHNFLTQDGKTPLEISTLAKQQVLEYPTVTFHKDFAISGEKTELGFKIRTRKEKIFRAKKIIFATGIKDTMLDIPGLSESWGISVVHCPYCHGYELRDQKTGILANGERAFHLSAMVNNLTDNLTILTNGEMEFDVEQLEKLEKNNIMVITTEVSELEHENGHLKRVIFKNGSSENFTGLYAALPFTQHSEIPKQLGCELTEHGFIEVDSMQKTSISGVFACGDNSTMMRSIANAVYGGNIAGVMVNSELTKESF